MPKKESVDTATNQALDLFAAEKESTTISDESLGQLSEKCAEMELLSSKIADRESAIAEMKRDLKAMAEGEIPEMMMALGLEELKTARGNKITLEKFYSAKIPADKEEEAFAWLEETNNGGLIKSEVKLAFGKGDKEREIEERVVEALKELDAPFTQIRGVHHSTLKALVRSRIEAGEPIDMELFGVYVGNIVKIRR